MCNHANAVAVRCAPYLARADGCTIWFCWGTCYIICCSWHIPNGFCEFGSAFLWVFVCFCGLWQRGCNSALEGSLSSSAGTSHVDAEFADICDAVSATQRIKHKTRLLFNKKHAPQLVRCTLSRNTTLHVCSVSGSLIMPMVYFVPLLVYLVFYWCIACCRLQLSSSQHSSS